MPEEEIQQEDSQILAKNIYVVLVNSNDQLLVEGSLWTSRTRIKNIH